MTYSSGHCSQIGVYRYIEGFLSLVSGRTVKLGDTSGAKGLLAACFLASLHAHQTCDKPGLSQTSKASVPTRSPAVFLMLNISKGLAGGIFAGLVPARLSIAQPSRIDNKPSARKRR